VSSRRLLRISILILVVAAAGFATRDLWLAALGRGLVHDEGPGKAEMAVVLAGDMSGRRLISSAELVRQGWVPRVLVSGPAGFYGVNEADAAIRFGISKGFPAEWFVALPHTAMSTREEAAVILADLKTRQIHSFLLVTSNYHTARARRIFLAMERRMGGGPSMRVVAAPDQYFTPTGWWFSREGKKTTFLEWTKTVTGAFGI
jgi:uncharacterized SAM-binding protein YcdF (DUF218 family)